MRFALNLLAMLCLLWCTIGIAEPAAAQDHGFSVGQIVDDGSSDVSDGGESQAPERGHHQHCPVAPDLPFAAMPTPIVAVASSPAALRYFALASLAHAPPLQPPVT